MIENSSLDIKKIHKGLIDKQGRRKYFKMLDPKLQETPLKIDIKSIKKKQKILFLMPNFNWIDEDVNALWDLIPWNLCLLAAAVEELSSEVKIIDAYKNKLSEKDLTKQIKDFNPDIVGITVLMDQYAKAGHITAKLVKNISNKIVTVLGGVYATANPKRAAKDENKLVMVDQALNLYAGLTK